MTPESVRLPGPVFVSAPLLETMPCCVNEAPLATSKAPLPAPSAVARFMVMKPVVRSVPPLKTRAPLGLPRLALAEMPSTPASSVVPPV
ncbi:Uncharacterised protein [Bordetella pertussis]|nr:Uncharacterised protein [Bordetella pertussis]